MNLKKYKQLRAAIAFFVAMIVSFAVTSNNYLLAFFGVVTGMMFLTLVRTKVKITVDEREVSIREKAAQTTYAIFAPTIGFGSLFLILFARGEYIFLQSLGMILTYLTLFLIALYSISYFVLNRKMGGGGNEE
ncbi:MAG: DUF2178 domain-containing protein [Microgenomates group bacterium]